MTKIKVIGGGLAGVEASYQLLKRGYAVDLYEMRPTKMTPAHKTALLAELVCSNSLKSEDIATSQGLLKAEMELFDSLVVRVAKKTKVPAGGALAVDRELFSLAIEAELKKYDNFRIINEEVCDFSDYTIVATGPLTSDGLASKIAELGAEHLHFYDAVAPIITRESVDMTSAFYQSRYDKGDADYLNCPMTKEEYYTFVSELVSAERVILKEFEKGDIFEGCMPIEVMAKRGENSLRFGPLRPVGLTTRDGAKAYAVVQLRMEDNYNNLLNLVGFQTNLTFKEQKRVFGLIPALKNVEFVRYGVMHRNTYINSPALLTEFFNLKSAQKIFFAGQITGVEGYMESAMSGLIAGINMDRVVKNKQLIPMSDNTMCGSLTKYMANTVSKFSPMHASFSLVPPLDVVIRDKNQRKVALSERAVTDIKEYINKLER